MTRIKFFFPYRGVGGVSVLFARMASALAERGWKVSAIDFPDGHLSTLLKNTSVELIPFQKDVDIPVSSDTVFVMQSAPLWRLPKELKFSEFSRLLLWNLHPYNLAPTMGSALSATRSAGGLKNRLAHLAAFPRRRILNRLVMVAHENKGIVFMDEENLEVTSQLTAFDLSDPVFLPVPVPPAQKQRQAMVESGKLNVGWLGRLADFKGPILVYTIRRLSRHALNVRQPTVFHVVGDGEFAEMVRSAAKEATNEFFKVRFYGEVSVSEMEKILAEKIDLLFAMGTSALEAAKMGVPVVLLDVAYTEIRGDYRYRMLHEESGYCLGRVIGDGSFQKGNQSLEEIVSGLSNRYFSYSEMAYVYYERNHCLDRVLKEFERIVTQDRFTFSKAKQARLFDLDLISSMYYAMRRLQGRGDFRIGS